MKDRMRNASIFCFELFLFTSFISISISQLFLFLMIVFFIVYIILSRPINGFYFPLTIKLVLAAYAWALISAIVNVNTLKSIYGLKELWLYLPILIVPNLYKKDKQRFASSLNFLVSSVMIIGVLGVVEYFSGITIIEFFKHGMQKTVQWQSQNLMGGGVIVVFMGHHLSFVGVLLLPLAYLLSRASQATGVSMKKAILFLAAVALILFNIIGSGGRSGILGGITSFVVFTVFSIKRFWLPIIAFVLVSVALFFWLKPQARNHFIDIIEQKSSSITDRKITWRAAWGMSLDHAVFGVGTDNFRLNAVKYTPNAERFYHHAHNDFLNKLAVWGFPGLFLFLLLLGSIAYRSFTLRNHDDHHIRVFSQTAMLGIVAFFVASQFQCYLTDSKVLAHFAVLCAMLEYCFFLTWQAQKE